jgi:hypothetical protein
MNRRQVFAAATLPATGAPNIAFASDWRVGFLELKRSLLRQMPNMAGEDRLICQHLMKAVNEILAEDVDPMLAFWYEHPRLKYNYPKPS